MATLALSLAGQVAGGFIGGPFGATLGRALGALAGSAVDAALFGPRPAAQPVGDVRITGAAEGAAIPRLYGWNRVAGTVIWATDLEKIASEAGGSKGFSAGEEEEVVASFALGLCEGEIAHVGRIWADGKLLDTAELTIRVYRGTVDQEPDDFLVAKQGEGEVPGYRGLAYLVFERLPLTRFGNRMPNLTVEVCRAVGELEPAIRAVCVIPGSTEFGYDPEPRVRLLGPGSVAGENTHVSALRSDWDVSIDELAALCPNLRHVGLVVSWFGTDLRCGQCMVEPRVEAGTRSVRGAEWAVAGRTRATASVVSGHGGGPAYGGTPSDASVVAAIRDLKARGLEVTLYPFVMMDIPADNALPNPYGGTGQPAYPWRGRVTCDPAPGRPGSVDKTAGAAAQVADFVAGGYREMVLHYAGLAEAAGGVDALLIGSELVGLTTVRDGASSSPFVTALRALAGEARSVVGADTRLSYAADWSEYFGYQPVDGSGDRLFHLDPLWADSNIDAVGIDNYMPISDWREEGGPDALAAVSPYDLDYLEANIAGGEGFDWYYASEADRQAGMRTPIGDGAYGEPWVYRFKDILSWWSRPHHNRIGGVRDPNPTAWEPGSKPIWMTEIGCGAVDKGTNAPNAFGDPKSAEDKRPYFSSGAPDALMQRQALRAIHRHWQGGGDNPQGMVDPDRLYVWCWDARPFPAFPGRDDVWSDAANYETGHWLNGRLGAAGAGEMLAAMAEDYGVAVAEVADALPLVTGCAIEQVTSLREAGAALVDVAGLVVADTPQGLRFALPDARQVTRVAPEDLVRDEGPVFGRRRGDPAEAVGRLTLHALDRGRDYQSMSVVALADEGEAVAVEHSGLVLEPMDLRRAAEQRLARLAQAADSVEAILPPEALAIEPGDLLDIDGVADGPFLVEETRGVSGQAIKARRWARVPVAVFSAERRRMWTPELALVAPPAVVAAHLPAEGGASRLVAGAFASPWPGEVSLRDGEIRLAGASRAAVLGVAETALGPGAQWMWDREGALDVTLYAGHLASRDEGAVLDGANRLAVLTAAGWEVIGFAEAELTDVRRYRLTGLLRGLEGTAAGAVDIGAHVLVLGPGLAEIAVPPGRVGGDWSLRAYAGPRDAHGVPVAVDLDAAPARLLAPVHVTAARDASGDIALRWVRRARGGVEWAYGEVPLDAAPERYRVTIRDGATILRVIEADGPEARYAAAEQDADWGGPAPDFAFTVEQISPASGPGAKAWGAFHG